MSNIEHLIENALMARKSGHSLEDFKKGWHTPEMIEMVNASVEEIWEIADYVLYTWES